MAIYIELTKSGQEECNNIYYLYQYTRNAGYKKIETLTGTLKINKETGEVEIVQLAPGDNGFYAQRGALALMREWRNGELPDKTCRAS